MLGFVATRIYNLIHFGKTNRVRWYRRRRIRWIAGPVARTQPIFSVLQRGTIKKRVRPKAIELRNAHLETMGSIGHYVEDFPAIGIIDNSDAHAKWGTYHPY
jgi:hypothetical protein